MSDKKSARPIIGVGVLVWRDKQLLLGKRIAEKQDVSWQFPGGHLEDDETVIQCASREVLEETGLTVKAPRHLGFTNTMFSVGERQYITLFVSCDYEAGMVQVLEPEKCEVWQWFDYQKLPSPLFQPIEIFLSQLANSMQQNLYELHCVAKSISQQ